MKSTFATATLIASSLATTITSFDNAVDFGVNQID